MSAVIARHDPQAGRELATRNQVGRARLALRANRASEAVEWLRKAGVDDLLEPPRDRFQLLDRLLSAEVHLSNGDLEVARTASQQVRTGIERLGLGDAAARELARLDIIDGRLRLEEADAAGATVLFRRALSVRQRVLDPQSPYVAEALVYLAKARRAAGDFAEAEQLLKAARVVLSAHPESLRSLLRWCADFACFFRGVDVAFARWFAISQVRAVQQGSAYPNSSA